MGTKQISICKNPRKGTHKLLDQLFENCYIDALSGRFHCKKCQNVVHVDLSRYYVYCPIHGMLVND